MNISEIIESLAPYIELLQALSFVATILLVVISIYALKQIRVAKNSLKVQSERDAKKLSTEHIYRYLDRIINNDDYRVQLTKKEMQLLKNFRYLAEADDTDNLDVNSIKELDHSIKLDSKKQREQYVKSVRAVASNYWDLLNELEAFAAVVTSGVLHDETVFRAIGSAYVDKIKANNLEQFVAYYSDQKNDYLNLLELYHLWNARLIVGQSERQLKKVENDNVEIASRIRSLKEEIKKIQPKTIESIGLDAKGRK